MACFVEALPTDNSDKRKRTKRATTATAIKNKTVETNLLQMIEYDEHKVLKGI